MSLSIGHEQRSSENYHHTPVLPSYSDVSNRNLTVRPVQQTLGPTTIPDRTSSLGSMGSFGPTCDALQSDRRYICNGKSCIISPGSCGWRGSQVANAIKQGGLPLRNDGINGEKANVLARHSGFRRRGDPRGSVIRTPSVTAEK